MSKILSGRRNAFGAGAISLLLVTASVVVAARTDGYRASHVDLNDASVWISGNQVSDANGNSSPQIGRVNTELSKINVNLTAAQNAPLFQDDDFTFFQNGSDLLSVDSATEATTHTNLPTGATIAIGGGSAAVLDPNSNVWVMPVASLATFAKGSAPQAHVDAGSLLVMGGDGAAYTYAPGQKGGFKVTNSGSRRWTLSEPSSKVRLTGSDNAVDAGTVELSVVGSTPVVLDNDHHRVLIGGGRSVQIATDSYELQQPGPAASQIVIAATNGLFSLPIHGGAITHLKPTSPESEPFDIGASGAARPVISQGCAYGAWASNAWEVRFCPQVPAEGFSKVFGKMSNGDTLVFRTNHDRVALNDIATGDAWVLSKANVSTQVTGWSNQQKKTTVPHNDPTLVKLPNPQKDCTKSASVKLAAVPWTIGARVGVPVKLSLGQIQGITAPDCKVISIKSVKLNGSTDGSTAELSEDGSTMQFTMRKPGPASATYIIDDGTDQPASANISITVRAMTGANDQLPVADPPSGRPPTFAVAGQTVSYNALDLATDPDGDPLSLVNACVGNEDCLKANAAVRSSGSGVAQFEPSGWIRYTAPQTLKGTVTLWFTISDAWGKSRDGRVEVRILDAKDSVPVTHDSRARVVQGQSATVDVLANDVSPAGRPLNIGSESVVQSPSGSPTNVISQNNDKLTVASNAVIGTYLVKYEASDGSPKSADGFARIDVVKPGTNPKPVTMLATAVARSGSQVLLDATANDFDDANNVLVVQSVSSPNTGTAQLLTDGHTIRIKAPDNFVAGSDPMIVHYTVSNGYEPTVGTIVVSPYASTQDQPPFTQDDGPVSIKDGMMTSIPVLENDVDPQGAPLRLVSVTQPGPNQGKAFVEGDQVRYVAPTDLNYGGLVQFSYSVTDAPAGVTGNSSVGQVKVVVSPASTPAQPPKVLSLTARAVQGRTTHIVVPLLSASPDGSIVGIAGISAPPTKGTAVATGDGFDYTPSTGASALGTDTFTFLLTDGKLYQASTVRIGVVQPTPSTGPVVTPIPIVVKPGQVRDIDLLDPAFVTSTGARLEVQVAGKNAPKLVTAHMGKIGEASAAGVISYVAPVEVGSHAAKATLLYAVQDSGGTALNTVAITVETNASLQAPEPQDDFVMPARAGKRVTVNVLANDVDPSGGNASDMTVVPSGAPTDTTVNHGKVSFNMPSHSVRFVYTATSAVSHKSAKAIVSVPLDVGVECTPMTIDVNAKQQKTIDVLNRCSGPPGTKVHLAGVTVDPAAGTAQVKDQKVNLTVASALTGDYNLSSLVCIDGPNCTNTLSTMTDTLRVAGKDDPPSLDAQISVPEDGQWVGNLNQIVTDPNPGDQALIKFGPLNPPSQNGISASLSGAMLTLTAAPSTFGKAATFKVHLDDTHGPSGQATGTINVTVGHSLDAPIIAVDDVETVIQTNPPSPITFNVLQNDVNLSKSGSPQPLKLRAVTQPMGGGGKVNIADSGSDVSFTPAAGFGGDTTFSYTAAAASDPSRTATATVTVHVVGFPGQPLAPQGVDKQNQQVTLQWPAATGNGGVIDHYTVQCQVATGGACPTSSMTTTTPGIVFTGLHNYVGYQFRVRAHNQAGDGIAPNGGWSPWSSTWTPDQVPSMPSIVSLGLFDGSCGGTTGCSVAGADGVGNQLTASWIPPDYEGSPVVSYTVQVTGGPGAGTFTVGPEAHSYTAKGLVNGTTYTFFVSAINRDGAGMSAQRTGTPSGVPNQVSAVNVVADTSSVQLDANWNPPQQSLNAATTGYDVTTSPEVSGGNQTDLGTVCGFQGTFGGSALPCALITGVSAGNSYTVSVRAKNIAGIGAPNSGSAVAKGPPGPVTNLTATPGDKQVILSFVGPASDGGLSPVVYQVLVNGSTISAPPATQGAQPGLLQIAVPEPNGTAAPSFTVQACNSWTGQGGPCGAESNVSDSVTPFPTPNPTNFNIGGGVVSFNWIYQSGITYSVSCNGTPTAPTTSGAATCNFGPGPPRSETITVTGTSQGGTLSGSALVSTQDTRNGTLSWSTSTVGSYCGNCYWIDVTLTGFLPNHNYDLAYTSNYIAYTSITGGPNIWKVVPTQYCVNTGDTPNVNCYHDYLTSDGNGNITIRAGHSSNPRYSDEGGHNNSFQSFSAQQANGEVDILSIDGKSYQLSS